jgi:hypothetical protein
MTGILAEVDRTTGLGPEISGKDNFRPAVCLRNANCREADEIRRVGQPAGGPER